MEGNTHSPNDADDAQNQTSEQQKPELLDLPNELLLEIALNLDQESVLSLSSVNKKFNSLSVGMQKNVTVSSIAKLNHLASFVKQKIATLEQAKIIDLIKTKTSSVIKENNANITNAIAKQNTKDANTQKTEDLIDTITKNSTKQLEAIFDNQKIKEEAKQIIEEEFMDGHHKIFNKISIELQMDQIKEEEIFVSAEDIKLISILPKSVDLITLDKNEEEQAIFGKKKQLFIDLLQNLDNLKSLTMRNLTFTDIRHC